MALQEEVFQPEIERTGFEAQQHSTEGIDITAHLHLHSNGRKDIGTALRKDLRADQDTAMGFNEPLQVILQILDRKSVV